MPYIKARIKRNEDVEKMENERFGLIAATIINSNPYRKKGSKVAQPSDFFVRKTANEPKKPTLQALYDKMRSVCAMMGGGNRV